MVKKPPMKRTPAKEIDFKKLEDFASEADTPIVEKRAVEIATPSEPEPPSTEPPKPEKKSYPWDSARPDVKKGFNLQLPEETLLKLRYISKHIPESQQEFLRQIIIPVINKKIKKLIQL